MIYFLAGNDTKKKSSRRKELSLSFTPDIISGDEVTKDILVDYASRGSLFGDTSIIVIEDFLERKDIALSDNDWKMLKESPNIFLFLEDSLLSSLEKKYSKYGQVEHFDKKEEKKDTGRGVFAICDAYAKKDKIGAWVLYRKAVEEGIDPENISGILFWKLKSMILNNDKNFSKDNLKKQSSELVTLHHKAHRGEVDFVIGLEQFILNSLS